MYVFILIAATMINSASSSCSISVSVATDDDVAISKPSKDCRGLIRNTLDVPGQGSNIVVCGVTVSIDIEHPFIGDLRIYLESGDITRQLMFREPQLMDSKTCDGDDLWVLFSDYAKMGPIITAKGAKGYSCGDDPAYSGEYQPYESLTAFDDISLSSASQWTLIVDDTHINDCGTLLQWELTIQTCEKNIALSTCVPQPISIPSENCRGLISNELIIAAHTHADEKIYDLEVYVDISHVYIGDLRIFLTHHSAVTHEDTTCEIMFRNVQLADTHTCDGNDLQVLFTDSAKRGPIITAKGAKGYSCGNNPAYSGEYRPYESLDVFYGISLSTDTLWTLTVDDTHCVDCGYLNSWSIRYKTQKASTKKVKKKKKKKKKIYFN
eukprot:481948_1